MQSQFQYPTQPISIFLEDASVDATPGLVEEYDLKITLDKSAAYMAFEPFISIIQFACGKLSQERVDTLLELPKTFAVLRPIIRRIILGEPAGSREPLNPDEMHYERVEIFKAFAHIIQQCFDNLPTKIAITHAEHIAPSSFEFLQIEEYRVPASLQLDFFVTSTAFQNLKISQGFSSQIKRRHWRAPLELGERAPSKQSLLVMSDLEHDWLRLQNAVALFCVSEMLALTQRLEQIATLSKDQHAQLLMTRMYAAVLQRDAARCQIYIQQLQHLALEDVPVPCATRSLKAICVAYLCLQEYRLGEKAAVRYTQFAQQHGCQKDLLIGTFYEFFAQCMHGQPAMQPADIFALVSSLSTQGWHNLAAFVKCSLWFHNEILDTQTSLVIDHCLDAITDYQRQANLIGLSTAHHHISIVLGINCKPKEAIAHINRALKLTQQCGLTNRIHNTLNGLAFLLNGLGQTDSAREAIEAAYPLVIADGNFDQIATTLYNLAMIAFYGNDQQTTIQLIDDLFSVMEYRNMTSTRFRTKGELLALQAIAAYIEGDRRLPLAIAPQLDDQAPRSHEGDAFIRCIGLITKSLNADEAEHFFFELSETFAQFRQNTHLELLALRLLVIYLNDLGEQQRAAVWAQQGIKQCEHYQLTNCQSWFKVKGGQKLMTTVKPSQAIELAKKQMGIDALKLENGLLHTLAAFNDSALRSGSIEELVDAFLLNIQRMVNVGSASLSLNFVAGDHFKRNVENEVNEEAASTAREISFDFQFIGGTGQLTVLFLGDLIHRSVDAKNLVYKICQQLAKAIEYVLERLDSYRLAYHDQLTQIYNRAALDEDLSRLLNERPVTKLSLAFLDLNHFKTVNDRYGHAKGDQFLQAFVTELSAKVRLNDRIYRIGGDEFIACFQDVNLTIAEEALQRFLLQFFSAHSLSALGIDPSLPLGCAIGIIECSLHEEQPYTADELLAHADILMYQAKRSTQETIVSKVLVDQAP